MLEENKAIVRRNFEEIWNKENFSVADETHASDYVAHIASSPEDIKGIQQFKQFVALFHFAFPDTQFTIEDQIAEGSKVATRWTARGTHRGEFMGIAPSGQALMVTGISIHRIFDGRIRESWDNWDALNMLQGIADDMLESMSIHM